MTTWDGWLIEFEFMNGFELSLNIPGQAWIKLRECVGPKAGESLKFMALTRKNWWHVQVHGAHKKELRVSKARWTKTGCLNCLSCLAYMVQKSKVGLPWRKYAMQSLSSSDCQLLRSWMDPCSWPKGPFRSVSTSCLRWTTKREREREGEKREREWEAMSIYGQARVWGAPSLGRGADFANRLMADVHTNTIAILSQPREPRRLQFKKAPPNSLFGVSASAVEGT